MSQPDVIYVDYSTLSTFQSCNEKGRLRYVEHLNIMDQRAPLVFGSAFHDGVAAYNSALAFNDKDMPGGGLKAMEMRRDVNREPTFFAKVATQVLLGKSPTDIAIHFFLERAKEGKVLPIQADQDERRSIERGVYILSSYIEKWSNDHYVNVIRPDTGEPMVEIGFAVYFMEWKGHPVVYVGRIDNIKRYRIDDGLYIFETKTTTSGIKNFGLQTRPNHQLTGYVWVAREILGLKTNGVIWDAAYVSDRKIDGKFPLGVDIENDFGRFETRRSERDIEEFLYDLTEVTTAYLTLRDSGKERWVRSAPTSCHMYGGCDYRDACGSNLNPSILRAKYEVKEWRPWEGITS